jgi:hypothetical protein
MRPALISHVISTPYGARMSSVGTDQVEAKPGAFERRADGVSYL